MRIQVAHKSCPSLAKLGLLVNRRGPDLEGNPRKYTRSLANNCAGVIIARVVDRGADWRGGLYITAHFSLSLIALLLCTGCNDTERFFSRVSRSRNRASTLWFVLAEVSRKPQPQLAASAAPSLIDTSRTDGLSSHLFPTWT